MVFLEKYHRKNLLIGNALQALSSMKPFHTLICINVLFNIYNYHMKI